MQDTSSTASSLNKDGHIRRQRGCCRHAFWIFIIISLLGLVIGTSIAGLQFKNREGGGQTFNVSASQIMHTLNTVNGSLPVHISLDDFGPSSPLKYVLNLDPVHFPNSFPHNASHLFCLFLRDDITGRTLTASLGFNSTFSMATLESTSAVLGESAQYPWDTYNARIQIWDAYLPHNADTSPPICDNLRMTSKNLSSIGISLLVQQDLLGFSTTASLDTSNPSMYPLLNITMKRDNVVIARKGAEIRSGGGMRRFAVCSPWIKDSTTWNSQYPCLARFLSSLAVGYFWNIAVVGLCMFSLITYSIIRLRKDKEFLEIATLALVRPPHKQLLPYANTYHTVRKADTSKYNQGQHVITLTGNFFDTKSINVVILPMYVISRSQIHLRTTNSLFTGSLLGDNIFEVNLRRRVGIGAAGILGTTSGVGTGGDDAVMGGKPLLKVLDVLVYALMKESQHNLLSLHRVGWKGREERGGWWQKNSNGTDPVPVTMPA
ncbi:hypothetical protein B0H14DRAFT_2630964 [Mycena olivaceomarginata]|nr:hypothetical protein B0H14DRAFT_2630964 [Mycena olivaceomarginata]